MSRGELRLRTRLLAVAAGVAALVSCAAPQSREVEVEVLGVRIDQATGAPVVLLASVDRGRSLPIWIGSAEARSIAMGLEGVQPPRPLTHDLMVAVLEKSQVALRRVVIDALRERTYHARLVLEVEGEEVEIDSRPSDAIALAVRFKRPIFVHASLFAEGSKRTAQTTARVAGMTVQEISADLAPHFGVPAGKGVVVADLGRGAGNLKRGDVIVEVAGTQISNVGTFHRVMAGRRGPTAMTVRRKGRRFDVVIEAYSARD